MPKYLLLLVPFFLTSCMTIQSDNHVKQSGDVVHSVVVDMSGTVNAMNSLGTGSENSNIPKDLCIDGERTETALINKYTEVNCTSLGDYRYRMVATLSKSNNPGIWIGSGVIVFNPLWLQSINPSDIDPLQMKEAGAVIEGVWHFPYPIVYTDIGVKLDTDSLKFDILDGFIMGKKDVYIIARADGKQLTRSEILKYKKTLRNQILRAKKSGKYQHFEDLTSI